MRKFNLYVFALYALLGMALWIGCSKDEEETGGVSNLMFVHGFTLGKNSTLIVGDSVISLLTAGYGNFTQYQSVGSGNKSIKVRDNTLDSIITQTSFSLKKDVSYSVMLVNNGQQGELILQEDDLQVADANKSYVRLINLCPNADNMQLNVTGGATVASGIPFKSTSGFMALDPGKYSFTIVGANAVLSSITNFNLVGGKKYSILMTGFAGQTPKATHNIIVNK